MTLTNTTNACPDLTVDGPASLVRTASPADLPGIVKIHQKAFSEFFLTRLGGHFLRRYYSLVLQYCSGIILVSDRSGSLDGFVCGFVEPSEFYRLMWRNRSAFVLPVISALFQHPSLASAVLSGVQRVQTSAFKSSPRSCELSSIAVAPHAAGNGLGKALVQAFVARARSMNAGCVYLTTDADENDSANALYRLAGFQHSRRFLQRKGRWMNEYTFLDPSVTEGCR
jgi:ribosomal protein S18 acetylase RimI-like enzyme